MDRASVSGRFGSVAMDEDHLIAAIRYVALNPVRARLVARAADWPHSSVRAHLSGRDDGVVTTAPVLERVGRFAEFLGEAFDEDAAFTPLRRERRHRAADWVAMFGIRRLEREAALPLRAVPPKPCKPTKTEQDDMFSKLSP